ncbi:hypothetical protein Pla8534_32460 [Lignipirellula cremea]|uniref:Uncharacterized protein n=1 Tax=Lignipirellula cremea TaxID=2528010 RepID=A0A518DUB8_9BACT|nr:hypothetical protein Pla8534_32460 [Lignipirellula cremea]
MFNKRILKSKKSLVLELQFPGEARQKLTTKRAATGAVSLCDPNSLSKIESSP